MKTNKNRLRLRKQVIYLLPVVILLTLLSLTLIISNHKLTNKVVNQENLATNKIDDLPDDSNFQLSDLKYFQEFYKFVEKRQKDNTVIYYASIFKLDIDKTLEIAYKYTNNFEDEEFNKNFVIGPKSIKQSKGSFPSFEAGVAYFARDLYRYPERYGSSIYEIRLDESPTIKTKDKKGNIIMDNGLTFEQYVGHISNLFEVDPAFTLAIINLESGYQSSYLFTNKNNVGGHRGIGGTWKSYTTLEAGVVAHVLSVKNIADKNNIDAKEMTNEEIYAFSGTYVTGSAAKPSSSWTGKVTKIKENISKKDLFTIK